MRELLVHSERIAALLKERRETVAVRDPSPSRCPRLL